MKIAIIVGTRPEIIKMSPIIRQCEQDNIAYFILHTGQHYSYNMDRVFFEQLQLPLPHYNLDIGSGTHGTQTAKILMGIEQRLMEEQPDIVLVEGDTNTVLAGALAASKLHINVGHVEAGLRSYDRTMPEEINRILTDHCSDLLFAPTKTAYRILLHEQIPKDRIFVTGNTIVDAVYYNQELALSKHDIFEKLHLEPHHYFLLTAHRQENVDNKERFQGVLQAMKQLHDRYCLPIVYPIHPRAKKMIEHFSLDAQDITFIDPLDYLSFLQLQHHAKVIITDSGGVQEEACILHVPCVTIRDNTERPETVDVGANILAGTKPDAIVSSVETMSKKETTWENPFGDGKTSRRILQIIQEVIV